MHEKKKNEIQELNSLLGLGSQEDFKFSDRHLSRT